MRHVMRRRRLEAFTLIELTMVIAILGILGAIAVPRLGNVLRRQKLDLTGRRIIADIQLARVQAIRDKADAILTFDPVNELYTLTGQAGNRVSTGTYTVNLQARDDKQIDLLAADFGGSTQLTFNKFGIPVTAGTVTVGDGIEKEILTISGTTGRVSRTILAYP